MIAARTDGASPAELAAHPWRFTCEVDGCFYNVCADSEDEAEMLRYSHGCPRRGSGDMGKSIIERAWEQLDAQVDEILTLASDSDVNINPTLANALEVAKARARGKAEVLALLMVPHYPTADAVAEEAGRRAAARQAGDGTYRTEGLR